MTKSQATLAGELLRAGLNEPVLAELLGGAWHEEDVPLVLDRFRSGDPRAALVRLFLLGQAVEATALPVPAEALAGAGLVETRDDGTVTATVRLTPLAGVLVAHDAPSADADVVTSVNATSRTLAALTVRRVGGRMLDLGTGNGVQALLAARHVDEIVATDVNPRALECAALGARLNGIDLDLRLGGLFDPVAGERFDLIVSNPPFVVSPDSEFVFRDSGLPGDTICRDVVVGAAHHLTPGGFATILCNWVVARGEAPWAQPARWAEGLPCDTLLVCHGVIEPLRYAARWNEPLRGDDAAYTAAVARWLDYYDSLDAAGIGIGAVVLRGRADPGWVHGFSAPRPATGVAGPHLERIFAGADRLAGGGDLLDEPIELVPGHLLEQTLAYTGGYEVAGVVMSLVDGAGLTVELDPAVLPLLFELGPDTTPRAAAAAAGVDADDARTLVRSLLEAGFV